VEIVNVLDAAELTTTHKQQVDRHEVAQCVFETTKPIALDCSSELETTGRFVLVDNYEIAGGGIVTEVLSGSGSTLYDHVRQREDVWEASDISAQQRGVRYGHKSKFIVITGSHDEANRKIARSLEAQLFEDGRAAYYLGLANIDRGLDADVLGAFDYREERIRRLGELARILTDSGQIFITSVPDLDAYDAERLKLLNAPNEILIIGVGTAVQNGVTHDVRVEAGDMDAAITRICTLLKKQEIIPDYCI
jgi:bifunctional enzyme CysN/CysC